LISPQHLAIFFTNEVCFEIYEIKTGKVWNTEMLNGKNVVNVSSTVRKDLIQHDEIFEHETCVVVVYDSTEIEHFGFSINKSEMFSIKRRNNLPPSGQEIASVSFFCATKNSNYNIYSQHDAVLYFFKNGAFLVYQNNSEYLLCKPNTKALKNLHYKLVDSVDNVMLLLGSNKNLYLLHWINKNTSYPKFELIEIKGNFTSGRFLDGDMFLGFTKGVFNVYIVQAKNSDKSYDCLKVAEITGHYDDVTFYFEKCKKK
jgi:hypothetical protein